jgi:D-alanine transfer protein
MKLPHLLPALVAILVVAAALGGGILYAQSVECRYIHALAPQLLHMDGLPHLNLVGSALQKEAFRQPDLLPVYGSSEITDGASGYTAPEVFGAYPTGFAPFEVANPGVTSLTAAQNIASIGPDLQGKKVIISFTPTMFLAQKVGADRYAGLFSRLHANELAFSTQLSFATKQAAARRMLEYPGTLEKEPLLRFALERLADGSPLDRALYYAVWPLGRLWTSVLELQDHWETLTFIWAHTELNAEVARVPAAIDWQALEAQAQQEQEASANNNPYGIDNQIWTKDEQGHVTGQPLSDVGRFAFKELQRSAEWTDLDILLRILKELGAQPLIMSRPINAPYWEPRGISPDIRRAYYDRLRQLAGRYGTPVVDFRDREEDKYFSMDKASHSSRKGWVYVNKAMDQFFHGTLR